MMAMFMIHKLYGDPRGRGTSSLPWQLFICWRLSIISRLQGKVNDAEYIEELYDATLISTRKNKFNSFSYDQKIYQDPFSLAKFTSPLEPHLY